MSRRKNRLVGGLSAVGAFLVVGVAPLASAPAANAEWDDLFQPIIDVFTLADPGIAADTDPGSSLASLDTLIDGWYQDLIYTPVHSIAPWLFGDSLAGSAAASYNEDSANLPDSFTVPMQVNAGTQPVISVSVGGGAAANVLVDTGAAGLVMPIWNINPFGITGLPTGFNLGQFGGNLDYFYLELPTTVTFTDADGDTVTADTTVDAVLFAFPATNPFGAWSIADYLGPTNAVGVLGIGPNALGPTPDHIPTHDLPGELGNGVLIDQANKQLTFGDNPYEGGTVIPGAPWADLKVQLNDGPMTTVRGVIDSGGVYGTMPSSALGTISPTAGGKLPDGTEISVYAKDGTTLLYQYKVDSTLEKPTADATHSPTVVSGSNMNTGNWLFGQEPVYINYGVPGGQTIIGGTLIQAGS